MADAVIEAENPMADIDTQLASDASILDACVSFYDNVTQKGSDKTIPLRDMLDGIQSGRWGDAVGRARAEYEAHGKTEAYTELKKKLPAFTPAERPHESSPYPARFSGFATA